MKIPSFDVSKCFHLSHFDVYLLTIACSIVELSVVIDYYRQVSTIFFCVSATVWLSPVLDYSIFTSNRRKRKSHLSACRGKVTSWVASHSYLQQTSPDLLTCVTNSFESNSMQLHGDASKEKKK